MTMSRAAARSRYSAFGLDTGHNSVSCVRSDSDRTETSDGEVGKSDRENCARCAAGHLESGIAGCSRAESCDGTELEAAQAG